MPVSRFSGQENLMRFSRDAGHAIRGAPASKKPAYCSFFRNGRGGGIRFRIPGNQCLTFAGKNRRNPLRPTCVHQKPRLHDSSSRDRVKRSASCHPFVPSTTRGCNNHPASGRAHRKSTVSVQMKHPFFEPPRPGLRARFGIPMVRVPSGHFSFTYLADGDGGKISSQMPTNSG